MSFKVYRTNKTLYVVNNDTNVITEALWQNVVISRKEVESTNYYFNFSENFAPNNMLALADIQKKDGTAYTEEEFLKFIDSTFDYVCGEYGTEILSGGKKVKEIKISTTTVGYLQINGGGTLIIPANSNITIQCNYNLIDPTIIFTDTDTYLITFIN